MGKSADILKEIIDDNKGSFAHDEAELKKEIIAISSQDDYASYFLFLLEKGIKVRNRINSQIAYIIGITDEAPTGSVVVMPTDLPDIDLDFEDNKRFLVKQHLKELYGEAHVVQLGTFATFKGRNSIDAVAKVFSIPKKETEEIKSFLIDRSGGDQRQGLTILDTFDFSPRAKEIADQYPDIMMATELEGQFRHSSSHACGMLLSNNPLDEIVAYYGKEAEDSDRVASVDFDGAKYLSLVKLDILGLSELSITKEIADANGMSSQDIYGLPLDDELTIKLFTDTNVAGIFQAEGESTKSILRQMHTKDFHDLVDSIALSKPGSAHSGGSSAYLARKNGREAPGFDYHPVLADITRKTYGQIIYQEQVLRIIRDIGNLDITSANNIRNLIAKSQGEEIFNQYWAKFCEGAQSNGFTEEQARTIWESIKTHGKWSFNLSHSVAYALIMYWGGYMKAHFPKHFYLAHFRREDDDRKKRNLMREATRLGIAILGPRFGYSNSGWDIDVNGNLRAGISEIHGVGPATATPIAALGLFSKELVETELAKQEIKRKKGDPEPEPVTISKTLCNKMLKIPEFFEEQEDYFHLLPDPKIAAFKGDKNIDIDWDDAFYPVDMAVVMFEMNLKSHLEEGNSRGRDMSGRRNPELDQYCMFMAEDDTDSLLFQCDRYAYPKNSKTIWEAWNKKLPIHIKGNKLKGWRIITVKEVSLL